MLIIMAMTIENKIYIVKLKNKCAKAIAKG